VSRVSRQRFIFQLAGTVALMSGNARPCRAEAANPPDRRRRFTQWVLDHQVTENDLCRYYRFGPHEHEESPLATAYAILLLNDSRPDVADRLAGGLARLQERYAGNRHVGGGVPSIANDESRLFYASDALAATKALLAAYKRNRDPAHLRSARGFVQYVTHLVDGKRDGFLVENLDFPMQYATPAGQYQNVLVPNVAMLFWDALRDFADAASDRPAATLFERGRTFLLNSVQAPNGAYYDHYDPGYPPRGYSPGRWRWFKTESSGRRIAIGDNMMMSALGALRLGAPQSVDAYLRWCKPMGGDFYAYMDVDTGAPAFEPGDQPYFDVVSSAMYYQLLEAGGRLDERTRALLEDVFARSAGDDGGYRWGLQPGGGTWVQDAAEAVVTGYWIATIT
jgi:hypothetical protein